MQRTAQPSLCINFGAVNFSDSIASLQYSITPYIIAPCTTGIYHHEKLAYVLDAFRSFSFHDGLGSSDAFSWLSYLDIRYSSAQNVLVPVPKSCELALIMSCRSAAKSKKKKKKKKKEN